MSIMSKSKFNTKLEAAKVMEYEGSEHFVTGYCRAEHMPDEESKRIFEEAEEAYDKFKEELYRLEVYFGLSI